jgi:FkbM family methyltransferase
MNFRKALEFHRYLPYLIKKIFGGQLTYAQLGEDLILEHLLQGKNKGTYIDVGANNPRFLSNTYLFYRKGWSGLTVDPNPAKIRQHKIVRPRDTAINCAVGAEGHFTYYLYTEDGLNTTSESTADAYKADGILPTSITQVNVVPLHVLAKQNLNSKHIDILSLDTEGNDMHILETNDWNLCKPAYIILETLEYRANGFGNKLNNIYDVFLQPLGYIAIAETHINTIYKLQSR